MRRLTSPVRHTSLIVALLALGGPCIGCECGEPARPALRPDPVAAPELPAPGELGLPRTERSDLPVGTPRVTVDAEPRGYRVSNRELVESWPETERARAIASAPPTHPDFPVVESDVVTVDPVPMLVTDLRDSLAVAAQADRARDPSAGAPVGFSIRAPGDLPWGRIVRAMYAGAMVGYSEPALVLRDAAGGERLLVLTSEDRAALPTRAETEERVRAALATLGDHAGAPVDEAHAEPIAPPATESATGPIALSLAEHGLRVRRGLVELGPDCASPASDGSPAIPSASLERAAIDRCLDVLGAFERASFTAAPDVTYAAAIEVLEVLHARGRPLAVSVTAGSVH